MRSRRSFGCLRYLLLIALHLISGKIHDEAVSIRKHACVLQKRLTIKSMQVTRKGWGVFLKREAYNKVMKEEELFVSFISVIYKSLSSYCHYFSALPFNRKLKKRRQRRWRRRIVKNKFIFYQQNVQLFKSVQHSNGSKNVLWLNISNKN